MSTTSVPLKLTLQDLDDNPDSWGDVLNVSTIELLEDAIAGLSNPGITAGNVTLDVTAGGDDLGNEHYRKILMNVTGSPGDDTRTITVPDLTNIYVVINATSDSSAFTVKTLAGSGVLVPAGEVYLLYCDAVDVFATGAATATLAATATTATDSDALGGVGAANYAQIGSSSEWTAGQHTLRVTLVDSIGDITPDLALSNTFFHEMLQAENLAAPTNPSNGDQFSLIIQQGSGAPWGLTFQANVFLWASGIAPTLSTTVGDVDYLAFEYVTALGAPISGARWIGSIIKDAS